MASSLWWIFEESGRETFYFFFVSECLKFFWAFFFFREVDFRLSEVRNKGKILEGRIDIEKNTIAIE